MIYINNDSKTNVVLPRTLADISAFYILHLKHLGGEMLVQINDFTEFDYTANLYNLNQVGEYTYYITNDADKITSSGIISYQDNKEEIKEYQTELQVKEYEG